jgi:16S rRNA (guanine966-N2)-methyltransferase
MRIIAGAWRGRPLLAPPGWTTRPTADRTREGLFSMLQSRLGSFEELHVADLFAGTGALGLEALSRGAAHCTFIESDRTALDTLRANLAKLGAEARADLRAQPVEHARAPARPCHLALLDPPYAGELAGVALGRLAEPGWLAPHALVSIETERPFAPPTGYAVEATRRFGKAHITLLRRSD